MTRKTQTGIPVLHFAVRVILGMLLCLEKLARMILACFEE